jgi:putative tryptophan/tyrosine transport system substrate-binding protein
VTTRRAFLGTLAGSLLAAPLAAEAQQPAKVYRIAFLATGSASAQHYRVEALRGSLRDLGYVEGKNIATEYRWAEGRFDRLSGLAAELVRLKVDIIVTSGTASTQAAMQATTTIPIVMVGTGDPLRSGLVASLDRPGGNVTGLTQLGAEVAGKRLQILKDAVPNVARVAFLWNPANASHVIYFGELQGAARGLGLTLQSVEVREPQEVERAFAGMMRGHPDALIVTADSVHEVRQAWIVDFTAKRRLPAMYQLKEYVAAGGLMSYGTSITDQYRRAATYVDKILKGAKPADLPVEQPTKFDLVINLKTAKALGLTIPPSLLQRADEVIQ